MNFQEEKRENFNKTELKIFKNWQGCNPRVLMKFLHYILDMYVFVVVGPTNRMSFLVENSKLSIPGTHIMF